MSALVMGLGAVSGVKVDDMSCIATSFPNFVPLMRRFGADFR
jgi:3-phosphoshikimate 1-carboxyvinyltransferase